MVWSHSHPVVTVPSWAGQVARETRQATDQVNLHTEPLAARAPSLGSELSEGPCLVPAYHVLPDGSPHRALHCTGGRVGQRQPL